MQEEKTEGLVLHAISYQENARILTLFTQKEGIVSLIVKGLKIQKTSLLTLTTPFCLGDFFYRKGKSSLFSFIDGSVVDDFWDLRKDFASFSTACKMVKAILDSQLPQKQLSPLYLLLKTYLKKISAFPKKEILLLSFLLKILQQEGTLHLSPHCNRCTQEALCLVDGESLCLSHGEQQGLSFTAEEFEILLILTYSKKFSFLEALDISNSLQEKVLFLFQELA